MSGRGRASAARTMTRATSGVWWLLKSPVRTASGGVRSVEASRPSVFHRSSHLRQIRRKAHSSVKEGAQLGEGEDAGAPQTAGPH